MRIPPVPPEMTSGFLIQLVFCPKKTMWFIGVEVEHETSAPPPKKNPGSAPDHVEVKPKSKTRCGLRKWSIKLQPEKSWFTVSSVV